MGFSCLEHDYPDVYWSWNYISSVGSLVSVAGIIVFLFLLWAMYIENNVHAQVKNTYYVVILNKYRRRITRFLKARAKYKVIRRRIRQNAWTVLYYDIKDALGYDSPKTSVRKHVFFYKKYNFFDHINTMSIYVYMDRYILTLFIDDFINSRLWSMQPKDIVQETLNYLKKLNHLSAYVSLLNPLKMEGGLKVDRRVLSMVKILTFGGISYFIAFIYLGKKLALKQINLTLKFLIINKMLSNKIHKNIIYILLKLCKQQKYIFFYYVFGKKK